VKTWGDLFATCKPFIVTWGDTNNCWIEYVPLGNGECMVFVWDGYTYSINENYYSVRLLSDNSECIFDWFEDEQIPIAPVGVCSCNIVALMQRGCLCGGK
jgi:hypothetical protein